MEDEKLNRERASMVEQQIRERGVRDERVLAAMRELPRHLFVPEDKRQHSHEDRPLPIGAEQTISQPYIVGLMLESLRLSGGENILEIGTGSGYQTALLLKMARHVVTMERHASLAEEAMERLGILNLTNCDLVIGDGTLGNPEHAPYDGIVITAAGPQIPPPLIDQLAEGGRLVMPLGSREEQMLVVAEKVKGEIKTHDVCPCRFVPLVGEFGFSD